MKLLLLILSLLILALSGCATRGVVNVKCDGLERFVTAVKPSPLIKDIQSDTEKTINIFDASEHTWLNEADAPSPMAQSFQKLSLENSALTSGIKTFGDRSNGRRAVLLLSGGGQWGAFGAGFLGSLHDQKGNALPDFGTITGVSTGGLQSLFVAIDRVGPDAYDRLRRNYLPKDEKEVVNRNPKPLAVVTGSLAGLKPLRRKIETALCIKGDANNGCPMIDLLARSGRDVFVGFVKADTGIFEYADAVAIAKSGSGSASNLKNAQQCLTGIALASAAMPVFFQQVRINDHSYYDGGVRLSVFEENVATELARAMKAAQAVANQNAKVRETTNVEMPDVYVIRNGPTQLLGPKGKPDIDNAANENADALTNAFRAEAIVVNQLEVGSIAALRLANPYGTIRLVTADGYHQWKIADGTSEKSGCPKPDGVMFDPDFMACLQEFGRLKAERDPPWKELSRLPFPTANVETTASKAVQP